MKWIGRFFARPTWWIDAILITGFVFLIVMVVRTSRLPLHVTATESEQRTIGRDIDAIRAAVIAYGRAEGRFPKTPAALVPAYLGSVPRDPYGREYVFIDGGKDLLWVFCLGSDGELKRYPPDIGTAIQTSDVRAAP